MKKWRGVKVATPGGGTPPLEWYPSSLQGGIPARVSRVVCAGFVQVGRILGEIPVVVPEIGRMCVVAVQVVRDVRVCTSEKKSCKARISGKISSEPVNQSSLVAVPAGASIGYIGPRYTTGWLSSLVSDRGYWRFDVEGGCVAFGSNSQYSISGLFSMFALAALRVLVCER